MWLPALFPLKNEGFDNLANYTAASCCGLFIGARRLLRLGDFELEPERDGFQQHVGREEVRALL